MKKKKKMIIILAGVGVIVLAGLFSLVLVKKIKNKLKTKLDIENRMVLPTESLSATSAATIQPSLTATPTPKPVSVEDMNKNFGPCGRVFTLMYHHIQSEDVAKKNGQINLTVTPEFLEKQLQYLKDKNYNVIGMADLNNFFVNGVKLPPKAVLLTFDDGYKDNYENMYPILKKFGDRATIFIPTGLLNNPGYLTWDDLNSMKDLVYFGNHTWSHHSSGGPEEKQDEEIGLADRQLSEHGFNNSKVFAYPYGKPSGNAEDVLTKDGYTLAFTTTHGSILCKGKKFELPRIRIGNAPLNAYGL